MTTRAVWRCALAFAAFRVLAHLWLLIETGGRGEGYGWTLILLDLPLFLLLPRLPESFIYGPAFVWVFSMGGVLMYGLLGLGVGLLARAVMRLRDTRRR